MSDVASDSTGVPIAANTTIITPPSPAEEQQGARTEEEGMGEPLLSAAASQIGGARTAGVLSVAATDPFSVQVASSSQIGEGRALIQEIIQASLSNLGHSKDGRIIYTTVSLSSLSLVNIDTLSYYKHLQKITLDNNQLDTLTALSECHSIAYLSAVGNRLTESVFDDIRKSRLTLEFLDLTGNCLTTLEGVSSIQYLRTLRVDGNQLTSIKTSELGPAKSLSVFSCSNNRIKEIDLDVFATSPIRSLNAGQNELSELKPFLPLASTISALSVADNNIMHFDEVPQLQKLHTLELSGNNCYDISEVHMLAQLPLLRTVSLLGNPLCSLHDNAAGDDDDDAASDIVQPDEAAAGADPNGPAGSMRSPPPELDDTSAGGLDSTAKKPAVIGSEGLTTRTIGNRTHRQDAGTTSVNMFKSNDDEIAALSPQDEDKIQFLTADSESQYRLRVLWRASNITQLDGNAVLPEELSHAKKLEGGATRDSRATARTQFLTSGGSAAFALRQSNRHRDPPRL